MSDVETIIVNFPALDAGAQTLSQSAQNLETVVTVDLPRQLQPMENTWMSKGNNDAAANAQQLIQDLQTAVAGIVQVINDFSSAVQSAHDNQTMLDAQIANSFGEGS